MHDRKRTPEVHLRTKFINACTRLKCDEQPKCSKVLTWADVVMMFGFQFLPMEVKINGVYFGPREQKSVRDNEEFQIRKSRQTRETGSSSK